MGLRIKTNVESLVAQRQLSSNNKDLDTSSERLASGLRINKSSDDAAGLAISENLRSKVRGLNQGKRNANDGMSLLQVAEGGLTEISNITSRLRELSVQAASDTIGDKERGYLQKEYGQLVNEIDRLAETTEFNGIKLLGPQDKERRVQIGYNGSEGDSLSISLSDAPDGINSESLGLKDTVVAGVSREEILGNLDKIDKALEIVQGNRAGLGASQSRMQSSITNISVNAENMTAAASRIRDVDFAEETAKATQSRILSQAGLSVLAQANQRPEMALSLLR